MSSSGDPKSSAKEPIKTEDNAPAELAAVVDELLSSLTTKFTAVSNEMTSKMDEMSQRLDALETAIKAQNLPKSTK